MKDHPASEFLKKFLPFLIIAVLLLNMFPLSSVSMAAADAKTQISTLIKNLFDQKYAYSPIAVNYNGMMYKEVKLKGSACIIEKNGIYQLDDKKKLNSVESDFNYYFTDFKNNLVTDPVILGKLEVVLAVNRYFALYRDGYSVDRNYFFWKTKEVFKGAKLMDQYYGQIEKYKKDLENEGFKENIKGKYTDELLAAPYNYLFNGEHFSLKKITKNVAVEMAYEAAIDYCLNRFSPYPNYKFRDFLNSTFYTWYHSIISDKDKVKALFQKNYIDNYEDAKLFLDHVNSINMSIKSYVFILNYIDGKVIKDKSAGEKLWAFTRSLTASPFDKSEGSLEGFEMLSGLPDVNELLALDNLSVYMRGAYSKKEDIFNALSNYKKGTPAEVKQVQFWANEVKKIRDDSQNMINNHMNYSQASILSASMLKKQAYDTVMNYLNKSAAVNTTSKSFHIAFSGIDSDKTGRQYYVYHVYNDMKDHLATIGWYGVEIGGSRLFDFVLFKEIVPVAPASASNGILGKGLKMGTYYDSVVSLLGKPVSKDVIEVFSDISPFRYEMCMKYDYAEITLNSLTSDNPTAFFLTLLNIDKKGYNGVFGIQVGDSRDTVKKKIAQNSKSTNRAKLSEDGIKLTFTDENCIGGYLLTIPSQKPADIPVVCWFTFNSNNFLTKMYFSCEVQ